MAEEAHSEQTVDSESLYETDTTQLQTKATEPKPAPAEETKPVLPQTKATEPKPAPAEETKPVLLQTKAEESKPALLEVTKTVFLPPLTGVLIAWGLTGKFSTVISKDLATQVEEELKNIQDKAGLSTDPKEKTYVMIAAVTIKASLRNLDIAYKGRELNFEENAVLRKESLNSIKETIDIGSRLEDYTKSLPHMAIGAAGSVTVAEALGLSGLTLWGVGIIFAALGFLIKMYFERHAHQETQKYYVSLDYERDMYYEQYINRSKDILYQLFLDLERIHKNVFGGNYETVIKKERIDEILKGSQMTLCIWANQHMIVDKKITPKLWPRCESGNDAEVTLCEFYTKPGDKKI